MTAAERAEALLILSARRSSSRSILHSFLGDDREHDARQEGNQHDNDMTEETQETPGTRGRNRYQTITDPDVFVSQVQGPNALKILEAASDTGLPEPFGYFSLARVSFGGQEVVITRTGYTNELGWEFYTEPHHDVEALWTHLEQAGKSFGADRRYPTGGSGFVR